MVNRKTTVAALEVAPIRMAPTRVIGVSTSWENSEPARAAGKALQPTTRAEQRRGRIGPMADRGDRGNDESYRQ